MDLHPRGDREDPADVLQGDQNRLPQTLPQHLLLPIREGHVRRQGPQADQAELQRSREIVQGADHGRGNRGRPGREERNRDHDEGQLPQHLIDSRLTESEGGKRLWRIH